MFQRWQTSMTLAELNLQPDQVRSLYLVHLQQMYSAEEQLMTTVPTTAINLAVPEIRQLLLLEATVTPDHLDLLKMIFTELGETPTGPVCMSIKALADLSAELILQHPFGPGRDLLLLAVALEMKNLNIAKFVMAETYARALELPEQQLHLSRVIREESGIERKLRFFLQNFQLKTEAIPEEAEITITSPSQQI